MDLVCRLCSRMLEVMWPWCLHPQCLARPFDSFIMTASSLSLVLRLRAREMRRMR
ncbi:hypothetical protein LINPERHAP1_LOCUS41452, partial [Linum perenne]